VRILTVLDVHTRECVAAVQARSFRGGDVVRVLRQVAATRALPKRIRVDNGTEFTSKALDHWAYWNGVALDFSRPAKPVDNTFIEAFNGTLRRECLSLHWFLGLEDLERTLEAWRDDYNHRRPHSSLADIRRPNFGPACAVPRTAASSTFHRPSGLKLGRTAAQRANTEKTGRQQGRIIQWVFHRHGRPIKDFRGAWQAACEAAGVPGGFSTISGGRRSETLNVPGYLAAWPCS